MMASSPVSAAASPVAPIQSQTGQTTIDEEVSRSGGTKRRRHPRPAAAAVPVPADAQLGPDLRHIYQLLVRHLGDLEEARNQRHEAWHAEMLAAIAAVHNDVQACRAEVLAAIADVRRLLRFLGLQ